MKFDASKAWSDATRMMGRNRDVIVVLAGVFFFLPYLAIMLLAPELGSPFAASEPAETPDEAMAQLAELGPDFFVTMVVLGLIQAVGVLAMLRLLTDRENPTVGEALFSGLQNLLPYIATQILQAFIFVLVLTIPLAAASLSGAQFLQAMAGGFVIVGAIYLFVRFSLISPIIAVDRIRNPIAALGRSWQLTKGRTGSLLFFFVMLLVATGIIFIVATVVFGLLFALIGGPTLAIGNSLVGALINAIWVSVFMAVLAAVHRQLASSASNGT